MSEEEKKAIKYYESKIDLAKRLDEVIVNGRIEPLEKIINLTKKQQKEIEEEKEANNETICQLIDEKEKLEEENRIFALQRDYYKARYNKFNEAFIENGRKLTK